MDILKFKQLAAEYNSIPVYEKVTADLITPVMAYLKLKDAYKYSFLLESVEAKETLGRYSFIGMNPIKIISNNGLELTIKSGEKKETLQTNIFDYLQEEIKSKKSPAIDELPTFTGGIVGFLGYENISLVEHVIKFDKNGIDNHDSIFGIYDTVVAFDHYKHQIILIKNVTIDKDTNLDQVYSQARISLKKLRAELNKPFSFNSYFETYGELSENMTNDEFYKLVNLSKENILNGDIFQIVLSKRFSMQYTGDVFNVYRALRILNPSPYMYYMEFADDLKILGTSPENLVKVKNRIAELLPIAGTRKRGQTTEEDKKLENDLVNDPKELAEHVMLLDLGRNDLGRFCEYSTVNVVENMFVQRYSHVMHLVSRVHGKLGEDKDCIDALKACFPAGTVTGAPKIRAIQLINDYENIRRNIYAGAIGYIDFSGNMDMCLAIRTLFAKGNTAYWQAGAGIVADSIPELEAKEIRNKSAVIKNALEYARGIDESISY